MSAASGCAKGYVFSIALACLVIAGCACAFALDPTSRISQYGHTAWRVQDGYFGSQPYAITQTTDGYIWVGTRDGLFQFDGVRFVRWSSPYGGKLPASFVVSLLGARDGSLWIGTHAGLAQLVNNRLIAYPQLDGWLIDYMMQDREGRIWIDRQRSSDRTHPLCQVLDAEIRCYGKEDGVDVYSDGPLVQDDAGNLWTGGSTTLVKWHLRSSEVYRPKALVSNEGQAGVTGLAAAPDGTLWVGLGVSGQGGGLQRMVNGTLKPFVAPGLNGEKLAVWRLMLDHQNDLWVGTADRGFYRIRGTEVDHYGSADGLSGDWILSIFEDRERNLWFVTAQGIDMFRNLRVKSISKREGLFQDEVQSLLALRDGKVWIGTSRLEILGPDGISSPPWKALPGHLVTSLFEDRAGRGWVGMDNTLWVNQDGSIRQITNPDGSPVGMVAGITEDSENNIWIESTASQGTLIRVRDLKVQQEFPVPAMPLARKIVADPQSGIWLGLVNGNLARYRSGQLTTFTFENHPVSRVNAITVAPDGSILGATAFGLIAWKNGKQQIMTERNGLPCNDLNALISDNDGNQWLYAQCGLVEIPKSEMSRWQENPESRLKLRVFDALDGVQPGFGNFTNSTKTLDGRLWFANGNAVQVIDPTHIGGNTLPPPVHVTSIVADHKAYPLESGVRLPVLTRDLEIDYTALSYAAPQKVLFRYRLDGRDVSWQEPGTRRQAFYNDLRPGRYRFRVVACNSDGLWNETGASLDFSVPPAFYQTTWFLAACGAAFLLILWATYQLRVRQLQRQYAIGLEAQVNERLRIARELHDTLLQSFQGVAFQLQAVRRLILRKADNADEVLDDAIFATEEAIREGRSAIRDLRPEPAAQRNLSELLDAAGRELSTAHELNGQAPSYRVLVEGKQQRLSPILQDEVYRISREVIRNAFAHAAANHIEVEIRYDPDELRLRVRDDGKGIDPKVLEAGGPSGHFGIPGMRERAQRIGARLDFWSEMGAGAEVELTVPASMAYQNPRDGHRFRLFH
jgi:signal transduction histidine kinase/ligand-binding sensor domain-containing protein